MSHFTVLALLEDQAVKEIGVEEALGDLLAPYSEHLEADPYKVHLDKEDTEAMANCYHLKATDLRGLADKMMDWYGQNGGVDEQGLYRLSTYNPKSTWDWYQIGGRWNGSLRAKDPDQKEGLIFPTYKGGTLYCDGGKKRVLDFEAMVQEQVKEVKDEYAKYREAVTLHGPLPADFRVLEHGNSVYEAAKQAYWAHPTVKALSEDLELWGTFPHDRCQLPEEEAIQRAALAVPHTYALLTKNDWYAKGKMGWFGMGSDTQESTHDYHLRIQPILADAPDDTWFVLVDCHI